METKEIKKAFDQMKKALKKELGISGGFTMSQQQIAKRTATLLVCNTMTYDTEIERVNAQDATVQSYETWTDAEKAASHQRAMESIAIYETRKAKYGTKENEVAMTAKAIADSKAFKAFQTAIGKVEMSFEEHDIFYYIRFNY